MDYELLYERLQSLEKDLRDKLAVLQKTRNSLARNSDKGELKSAAKDLAQMSGLLKECEALTADYAQQTENFNVQEYMESGDFARQTIEACQNLAVDIKGEYPVYEIFPYKVKIDSENAELYIDRKKLVCARPLYFSKLMKTNQDKLNKASFNADAFLNELAGAYDTAILHKSKTGKTANSDSDIFIKDLYGYIVPMQRFRKDYDMQSYAFDLSRLYRSEVESTKDGRKFQFGPSRQAGKLIRILDQDGKEQFLGTIRFFKTEA